MSLSTLNPFGSTEKKLKYITSREAQEIDDALMSNEGAFSLDQVSVFISLFLLTTIITQHDAILFTPVNGISWFLNSSMFNTSLPPWTSFTSRFEWHETKKNE